jgi:hypothetical protein
MKKERELAHLELFREILSSFPTGTVEESESPDFIIHTDRGLLGIEHTQVFQPGPPHGGSLQAQDSLARSAVKRASELHIQSGGPPLLVQILFNPQRRIRKRNIDEIATAISGTIAKADVKPGDQLLLGRTPATLGSFPKEVALIAVRRPLQELEDRHHWRASSAGFVPMLGPDYVQAVIDRKEPKLVTYNDKCAEVWLLIVAEALRAPSSVDIDGSAVTHKYTTNFDRVFFLWYFDHSLLELKTCAT